MNCYYCDELIVAMEHEGTPHPRYEGSSVIRCAANLYDQKRALQKRVKELELKIRDLKSALNGALMTE